MLALTSPHLLPWWEGGQRDEAMRGERDTLMAAAAVACLVSLALIPACGEENNIDQAFRDGFEEGYAEGSADAQCGTGGTGGDSTDGAGGTGGAGGVGGADQTLTLEEIALNVGWFEGLLTPLYLCSSDGDCLKGEVCWQEGFCAAPPACDEPHPDTNSSECQKLCFSRYDISSRYIPCLHNCRCEPHLGDEVACQSDDQCRLPWRPECVDGLCGGEAIAPDDFYKLVMTERFCDEPDDVPAGFTCE